MQALSRRKLLRGAGLGARIALPLPFLASLASRRTAHAQPTGKVAPKRVLVFFSATGSVLRNWRPAAIGENFPASRILEPLCAPDLKPYVTVLSGINMRAGGGWWGPHPAGRTTCLTATEGDHKTEIPAGPSVDVAIGKELAARAPTPYESLQFGVQSRTSVAGSDRILSYRQGAGGAIEGVFAEDSPSAMYDKLFANLADAGGDTAALERLLLQDRSVLDFAREEYKAVAARLSGTDRARLDEFGGFLRSAEQRRVVKTCGKPTILDPGARGSVKTVTELHMDMIAAAFACDLTRSATLQFSGAESSLSTTALDPSFKVVAPKTVTGVKQGETTSWWHGISHLPTSWDPVAANDGDKAVLEVITKMQIWLAERLAYLARKLKSYQDVDGRSVLDNTLIFWTSENAEGTHSLDDMPFTVIGNLGGSLRSNIHLAYNKKREHGDVFATIGTAMGLPWKSFGNPKYSSGLLTDWLR
jgi:hypothetical protein